MAINNNTAKIQELLAKINALPNESGSGGGVTLPTLSNPASALQLLTGYQLIDGNGNIVNGGMANNGTVTKILSTSEKRYTIPQGYHSGSGSVRVNTETKTVTPSSEQQIITPSTNMFLEQVIVEAIAGSGGLPSGVSALASGEIIPTQDTTSTLSVTHNLGVAPNFCIWWDTADFSSSSGTGIVVGGAMIDKKAKYNSTSTMVYNVLYSIYAYNSSGVLTNSGSRISNTTDMTSTTVNFRTTTGYPIKAGHTYKWVCGVMG